MGMWPLRCGVLTLMAAEGDSPDGGWPSASAALALPRRLLGGVTAAGAGCAANGERAGSAGVLHGGRGGRMFQASTACSKL